MPTADRRRRAPLAGLMVACLAAVALLAAQGEVEGTRSGGRVDPMMLGVADFYGSQLPPPGMQIFAEELWDLSGGTMNTAMRVKPTGLPTEPEVLHAVASGEFDLGFVGTRSLDQVGIGALQPLSAPFLIDSYPSLSAVVTDPAVTSTLSALEGTGVVGLALLADELSLPFGLRHAPRSPDDYRGRVVRTDPSTIQADSLAAMGATPVTSPLLIGADVPFEMYDTSLRHYVERAEHNLATFLTVNTPLWPQTSVILMNRRRWDSLTEQQSRWIREAASYATRWSAEHAGDQAAEELEAACGLGLNVARATSDQRAALRTAVEPIYAQMRADPHLNALLARIEQLVAATSRQDPPLPESCMSPAPTMGTADHGSARLGPGRTGDLPQGVYRYQNSLSEFLAHGMADGDAKANAGIFTWTLHDGQWSYRQQPMYFTVMISCSGYYDVQGGRVDFTTAVAVPVGSCAPPTWSARWEQSGQDLVWSDVTAGFAPTFAGPGWTRIG